MVLHKVSTELAVSLSPISSRLCHSSQAMVKLISSSGEPNFNIVISTKSTKGIIKWAFPKYRRNGYAKLWKKKQSNNYINTKEEKFQYAFVYRSLTEHCICRSPKKIKKKEHDLINNNSWPFWVLDNFSKSPGLLILQRAFGFYPS